VALATPADRGVAILSVGLSIGWAAVRLVLLTLSLPSGGARSVVRAWGLGTAAWLLAVTPVLQVGAWLLSAVVTQVALERETYRRAEAVRAVVLAWGVQALLTIGYFVVRSGLVIVQMSR
jgi:hypothetical protein